jgi:teichuronic acid biosynthesis glycosyltransferase TuaC
LKDLSGRLDLMERVEFRGKIVHGEVIDLMKEADLFVLPSLREAFGVVYIEAMACGKPVIACRGEGIEDVIEDGVNGILVEPNDVDDLVKKIELLLSDRKRAEQIGQAGRKLVLEKYTWAENAGKTIALYKEVLGDG